MVQTQTELAAGINGTHQIPCLMLAFYTPKIQHKIYTTGAKKTTYITYIKWVNTVTEQLQPFSYN